MSTYEASTFFKKVIPSPSVELRGVNISYSQGNSNGGFSLDINQLSIVGGTIHCIYGTNGCGKTSILRLLAGLMPVSQGSVNWQNLESPKPGRDYILVTQAGPVPHWTVHENITEPQIDNSIPLKDAELRTRHVIELLGLQNLENRYAHQLSAGQQQRTVLARALALSPKILLLDEIMSGQSEYWAERIAELLRQFVSMKGLVIMVSHDPEWVMVNADRVTHIVSGHGDAVSATHFFCGYDGDGKDWLAFREARFLSLKGERR